ncbi:DUF1801 domain-containing protein [Demequina lignilytica]|uniref:DUF1801 domain-containing protein n=1 Tax=Demequina lignilytica TaxID=3051663 RepID=A0AB35MKW2_9MICO|nr:DUF1801 domain-containing protein [Demequina sp. SYSU T0a273]MDN4484484.1 DUF1801 domain-containing protein [Demequina sp. SYSU T0a273]
MANKTQPTDVPVEAFIAGVTPDRRREDAERVVALFTEATGVEPVMWGPSIIGWGSYRYRTAAGTQGDWPPLAFSPRKAQLTFYGFRDSPEGEAMLSALGPHTTGVGCVYVKRLEDLDREVLADLAEVTFHRGDHDATAR